MKSRLAGPGPVIAGFAVAALATLLCKIEAINR